MALPRLRVINAGISGWHRSGQTPGEALSAAAVSGLQGCDYRSEK
ncbi:hypothetical protein HMPREF0758_0524 [Serratia odorifera DSM 4582]|uniref:Uncharacterized protein n=1 Tax=Serratia odorifera DSM 4582 TaxID=667129 RepID=D4DX74_SEROD|nr:hypothetical protein HMPREF0758_0524 [Serratia odorifera DSM 4582]